MASSGKQQQQHSEDSWDIEDGTVDDVREAVVANLEHRGVMRKLRAKVRAEVFHTLEGPKEGTRPATLSNESLLINELVREYLTYSGYHNALSVFMAESGQPQDRALDRAFIRDELGLTERRGTDGNQRPPLLYGITHALKRWKEASSKEGVEGSGEDTGGRTGGGPRRVPVNADEDFLLPGSTDPATAAAAESVDHGVEGNHPAGMGKRDPPPLVFTKRSGSGL